jgi:hypothetical protein
VFLWFWPRGIVPERRRRFPRERTETEAPAGPRVDRTYAAERG